MLVREVRAALNKARAAEDGGKEIVEIVSDATGELADRIHLLGLDELAFQQAPFGDIGQGAGIFLRPALGIPQQHRLIVEIPVTAVGAVPAVLDGKPTGPIPLFKCRHDLRPVVVVEALLPEIGVIDDFGEAVAGHRVQIAADELGAARIARERFEVKDDRQRLDDRRLPLFRLPQTRFRFQPLGIRTKGGVEERLLLTRLSFYLVCLCEQFDEHGDLGAQNDRVDRLEDIIDGAHRIAADQMLVLLVHGGQKNDRDMLGLLTAADDLSCFIAVDVGHEDIEQDDGEFAPKQLPERLLAGVRDHHLSDIFQNRTQRQQVALIVIDDEHALPSVGPLHGYRF